MAFLFLAFGCRSAVAPMDGPDKEFSASLSKQGDSDLGIITVPAAPPLQASRVYVVAMRGNADRALITVLAGAAAPDVVQVCALNTNSGARTCMDAVPSEGAPAFTGVLEASRPGDTVKLWGNGPAYAPGGPDVNSIDEPVLYWHARYPRQVSAFARTDDGALAIGSDTGLYLLAASDLATKSPSEIYPRRFTASDGLPETRIHDIAAGSGKEVFFSSGGRLGRLSFAGDGAARVETFRSVNSLTLDLVGRLCPDGAGGIWFTARSRFVDLLVHLTLSSGFPAADSYPLPPLAAISYYYHGSQLIARGPDGSVWLGTTHDNKGIFRFSDGRWTHYSTQNGLPGSGFLTSIAPDGAGSLWVSFRNLGVRHLRISPDSATVDYEVPWTYGLDQDLVISDGDGGAWVRSYMRVVHVTPHGPGYRENSYPVKSLWYTAGRALFRGPTGGVWVDSHDGPVHLNVSGGSPVLTEYRNLDGLGDDVVGGLATAADGSVWVGTQNGLNLLRFDENGTPRFELFLHDEEDAFRTLPDNVVMSVADDGAGGAWVGTANGLARFRRTGPAWSVETYYCPVLPGTCGSSDRPLSWVTAVASDSTRDEVWIASSSGLFRFRPGEGFALYSGADDIRDSIRRIVPDTVGGIWLGTSYGLYHARPDVPAGVVPLTRRRVTGLASDGGSGVWLADDTARLTHFSLAGSSRSFDSGPISALVSDPLGGVWGIGADLVHATGDEMHRRPLPVGPLGYVLSLAPGSGGLFVGTTNGLHLFPK